MSRLPVYLLNVKHPVDHEIHYGCLNKPTPPKEPEDCANEFTKEQELRMPRYRRAKREHAQPGCPGTMAPVEDRGAIGQTAIGPALQALLKGS